MADKTGAARLRQAVENQASAGEASFSLPVGEARTLCDECEDELARVLWAQSIPAPVDADGEVVPLDATELYTDEGEVIYAGDICLREYSWYARSMGSDEMYRLDTLHLTERDSWELLEKDVLTLVMSKRLADPEGDVKECISRAKALAERDAKASTPQSSPHEAKEVTDD